jgi:hypothetical protein
MEHSKSPKKSPDVEQERERKLLEEVNDGTMLGRPKI